jgi:predicted nucleotidyltransferase component of viral defense system
MRVGSAKAMAKKRPLAKVAASVRQRLVAIARERREEMQSVLVRYGVERLLYRLGESANGDRFVLKGAVVFSLWDASPHRPTRDVDFLAYGDASLDGIAATFRDVCATEVEPDGVEFLSDSVRAEAIRDRQEYGGVRVTIRALLANARIPIQVDVGFGDAVTPPATLAAFPTLLDFPAPRVRAYPPETVVAEKLEAMISLGVVNTRLKDFYDVWLLANTRTFEGGILARAIAATFARRGTAIPAAPATFSVEFSRDREKQAQWKAFLARARLTDAPRDFEEVTNRVASFSLPAMAAAGGRELFAAEWTPETGWHQ